MPLGLGPLDTLAAVADYLTALQAKLADAHDRITSYVDGVAGWAAQTVASLGVCTWKLGSAQLSVDNVVANAWLGGTITAALQNLGTFVGHVWDVLVNGVLLKLYNLVEKILAALRRFFDPLIKLLQAYKQLLDYYFNTYIKPIFDFLQRLRRILAIFRLLGFKWAAKLDQDLAALEGRIAAAFLKVQTSLNQVIDWITFITDPLGIFNPVLTVLSAIASIGDLFNALWQAQTFGIPAGPTTDQQAAAAKYTQSQVALQFHAMAQTGVLPDDAARAAQVGEAFQSLGYTVSNL